MRFFGRGQDNRATGSYPSSSHAVRHVMHWHKRKQLMQRAHWIHGLGTAAWIWQGFLFVALFRAVPYICLQFWADRQDMWLCRRTWGYLTNFTLILSELLLYFTSENVFCWSLCTGDLSSIWRTSQWPGQFWGRWYSHSFPQKTSQVLQFFKIFLPFFFPLVF